jgi:uncharacterized protein (TIGR02453 family)
MNDQTIHPKTMAYLSALAKNNDRSWFKDNKHRYDLARENVLDCLNEILQQIKYHDDISTPNASKSLYRINRDVRFSKDKSPYNLWFSGYFRRATDLLRGGYYFRIQPGGQSMIGGGFWGPNKEDLNHIRNQIVVDSDPLRKALTHRTFKSHYSELQGEQVKTYPRGFAADHPDIDLLRYKQFLVSRSFTDKEVMQKDFGKKANEAFKAMRPFLDAMSLYLTTDLNGERLPHLRPS